MQWVGEAAWSYRLTFDATVAARSELVFEGVDGFATITLNGTCLGRAENQHRTYRFDASTLISAVGNELVVATAGALRAVHGPAGSDRQPATPRWATAVELAERSVAVTVQADTVVRDLCLFADRIDPWSRVDEQLVTLLPGESHTFTVETRGAPERAAWTGLGRPGGSVLRAIGDHQLSDR